MSFLQFHNTQSLSRGVVRARITAIDPNADVDVYEWYHADGSIGGSYVSVQSDTLTSEQLESVISEASNPADAIPPQGERLAALEDAVLTLSGV